MSLIRKMQKNKRHETFYSIIPKGIVEALKFKAGMKLSFSVEGREIHITPGAVNPAKTAAPESHNQTIKEGAACQ